MPIRKILFVVLLFSVSYSCTKYAEGPNMSLKSEAARLVRKWRVQAAYYSLFTDTPSNGEDQTLIWQNLKIEFKKDNTYQLENYNSDKTEKTIENGTWEFTDDLSKINTSGIVKQIDVETEDLLDENAKNSTWRIMRLTKKELWVWYQNQVDPPWIYMKLDAFK